MLAGTDGGEGTRLHALAAGEPVTFTGYIHDAELDALITGGDAAAYFDPADTEDLTRCLLELLADPARRAQLATAGSARAAGFSWDATARATAGVYREVLER